MLETITTNGIHTTALFGGNVGRVRVVLPGPTPTAPDIILQTMKVTRTETFVAPVTTPAIANTITAFPLTMGQPVDVTIHDGRPDNCYFTLNGVSDIACDVVVVGNASVWIR